LLHGAEILPINDGPMHWQLTQFIIQIELVTLQFLTFDKLVFNKENTPIEEPNRATNEFSVTIPNKVTNNDSFFRMLFTKSSFSAFILTHSFDCSKKLIVFLDGKKQLVK
jgi:hypothetical protein